MTDTPGPWDVSAVVDRLEDEVVDVARAARGSRDEAAEDTVSIVPGVPEPPD